MTELEIYKKALEKISKYGIKPTSETELQRIKRLKSIADGALFIANILGQSEQLPICKCENTERIEVGGGSWNIHCKDCGKNW